MLEAFFRDKIQQRKYQLQRLMTFHIMINLATIRVTMVYQDQTNNLMVLISCVSRFYLLHFMFYGRSSVLSKRENYNQVVE